MGSLAVIGTKDSFKAMLMSPGMQEQLNGLRVKHFTMDKIVRLGMLAANKDAKILRCSKTSVARAICDAAALGLDFGGLNGEGWIIPYGQTAQFIPGYRGLATLARRSGEVGSIYAELMYENDPVKNLTLGTDPKVEHTPLLTGDRGAIVCGYGVAKYTHTDHIQICVMTIGEIESIRARSAARGGGPWSTDYAEMCKKTVVRRLCKMLPASADMTRALELEIEAEVKGGGFGHSEKPKVAGTKELVDKLKGKKPATDEEPPADDPTVDEGQGELLEQE